MKIEELLKQAENFLKISHDNQGEPIKTDQSMAASLSSIAASLLVLAKNSHKLNSTQKPRVVTKPTSDEVTQMIKNSYRNQS